MEIEDGGHTPEVKIENALSQLLDNVM